MRAAAATMRPRRVRQPAACIASASGSSSRSPVAATSTGWSPRHAASRADWPSSSACRLRYRSRSVPRTSIGTARAGPVAWRAIGIPIAARLVAVCRVRRGCAPARRRRGGARACGTARRFAVRPGRSTAALRADPEGILGGLDSAQTWNAVIDAEPALGVTLSGDDVRRARLRRSPTSSTSSRRTRWATRERWPSSPPSAGAQLGLPEDEARSCAGPASSTASGGWASRTRSGTSPARSARASGSGSACTRT